MLKNQSKLVHIIKNICLFLIIETLDETKAVMEITQTLNITFKGTLMQILKSPYMFVFM